MVQVSGGRGVSEKSIDRIGLVFFFVDSVKIWVLRISLVVFSRLLEGNPGSRPDWQAVKPDFETRRPNKSGFSLVPARGKPTAESVSRMPWFGNCGWGWAAGGFPRRLRGKQPDLRKKEQRGADDQGCCYRFVVIGCCFAVGCFARSLFGNWSLFGTILTSCFDTAR